MEHEQNFIERVRSKLGSWLAVGLFFVALGSYQLALSATGGDESPLPQTLGEAIDWMAQSLGALVSTITTWIAG